MPSLPPEFENVKCKVTLIEYLVKTPNPYNDFILARLKNEHPKNSENLDIQKHHIIPRHIGGPNRTWNLVRLTVSEHREAHRLRWETYNNQADELALRFMQEEHNTPELIAARVALSHEYQRTNQIGRWNSEQQSRLGRIGGSRQTQAKREKFREKLSVPVKNFLDRGSTWYHKSTMKHITFAPNELFLVTDLLEKLIEATEDETYKQMMQNTRKSNATSVLAKVIKGERPSCYNWFIQR